MLGDSADSRGVVGLRPGPGGDAEKLPAQHREAAGEPVAAAASHGCPVAGFAVGSSGSCVVFTSTSGASSQTFR